MTSNTDREAAGKLSGVREALETRICHLKASREHWQDINERLRRGETVTVESSNAIYHDDQVAFLEKVLAALAPQREAQASAAARLTPRQQELMRPDGVYASEFQWHAGETRDSHENRLRNEVEALKRGGDGQANRYDEIKPIIDRLFAKTASVADHLEYLRFELTEAMRVLPPEAKDNKSDGWHASACALRAFASLFQLERLLAAAAPEPAPGPRELDNDILLLDDELAMANHEGAPFERRAELIEKAFLRVLRADRSRKP